MSMTERQKGAAAALILGMAEQAIQAQRDGGPIVEVAVKLNQEAAQTLGFAGQGEITLRLEPAFGQLQGDLDQQYAWDRRKGKQP